MKVGSFFAFFLLLVGSLLPLEVCAAVETIDISIPVEQLANGIAAIAAIGIGALILVFLVAMFRYIQAAGQ